MYTSSKGYYHITLVLQLLTDIHRTLWSREDRRSTVGERSRSVLDGNPSLFSRELNTAAREMIEP